MRGGGLLPRTPFASATALLAAAEEAAASPLLEDDVRRRILRSFVKAANPYRRRTLSSTLAGSPTDAASSPRRHLRDASCDELLAAVRLTPLTHAALRMSMHLYHHTRKQSAGFACRRAH